MVYRTNASTTLCKTVYQYRKKNRKSCHIGHTLPCPLRRMPTGITIVRTFGLVDFIRIGDMVSFIKTYDMACFIIPISSYLVSPTKL